VWADALQGKTWCGVWGVGCGVWGVGCGLWGMGCWVQGVGCEGSRVRVVGGTPVRRQQRLTRTSGLAVLDLRMKGLGMNSLSLSLARALSLSHMVHSGLGVLS
jgi:hypothetical protein